MFYRYSIVDEFGETVNRVAEDYLKECINFDPEDPKYLCVGSDMNGTLKYTRILLLEEK